MARPLKLAKAICVIHPHFFGLVNFPGSLTKFFPKLGNIVTIFMLAIHCCKHKLFSYKRVGNAGSQHDELLHYFAITICDSHENVNMPVFRNDHYLSPFLAFLKQFSFVMLKF